MKLRSPYTVALVSVALGAAVAAWWLWIRAPDGGVAPAPSGPSYRDANVLLITIDTLRADRLGAWGWEAAETPRLDGIGADGIRFAEVVAPVPLTLPSHTSLLTSRYPPDHGVRDNGAFEIAEGATTLAEELRDAGYDTAAFVGAYVLDSRWGLDRGFDVYDDRFEVGGPEAIPGQAERRAERVVDAALPWLTQRREAPFFAWVHLYDPHSPYAAPDPWGERLADPYDAEVAYTDAQIGRLLDGLEEAGLTGSTVLVVTADHGEGLGDHEEPGHGMFLYDTTLLVPLLMRLPDAALAGRVVEPQVPLIDVAPTVLALVGLPVPAAFDGETLLPFLVGEAAPRPAYAETWYPRWHFGWQELHALRDDGLKYVLAPRPELYDVRSDPGETRNLIGERPLEAAGMRAEVVEMRGGAAAAPQRLSGEAAARLRSLGYIGAAPAGGDAGPLPDPKDKIDIFRRVTEAQGLLIAGRWAEVEAMMEAVIAEDPRVVNAHFTLGSARFRQDEYAAAAAAFEATIELAPEHDLALFNLGLTHRRMGDRQAARADFEAQLLLDPTNANAMFNLGEIALEEERFDDALERFRQGLEIDRRIPDLHFGVGVASFQLGRTEAAESALQEALEIAPRYPEAHYYLALVAERRGEPERALELYREEVETYPGHHRSWFNLAQLHAAAGDHRRAIEAFEGAIGAEPDLAPAHLFLARSLLAREDPVLYRRVEEEARLGLRLDPPATLRPLGHYVLADVYNRLGRPAEAQRQLDLARQAEAAIR